MSISGPNSLGGYAAGISGARPALSPPSQEDKAQYDLPFEKRDVEPANERRLPYVIVPSPKLRAEQGPSRMLEQLQRLDVLVTEQIPLVNGFTAVLTDDTRRRLERAGFQVTPDTDADCLPPRPWERRPEEVAQDIGPKATGPRPPLSEARFATGLTEKFTGRGVGIAVLDTGIYPHPDFNNPYNRIVAFKDFVGGRSLPYDDNGHGTHVAGDAAGNGFLSGGLYRAPAPEANVIGVKVLGKNGNGKTSTILKGINWVVENKDRYNIKVINLSLGKNDRPVDPAEDPIQQAIDNAVRAGVTVVVAAGNEGPYTDTISAPADNPNVITVGALDDRNTPDPSDDRIPDFSSRGRPGTGKPDLLAPGEAIIGPNAPGSVTEAAARKYADVNGTLSWLRNLPGSELVRVPEETMRMMGVNEDSIRRIKSSPSSARLEMDRLLEATERLPLIDDNYVGSPGTSMAAPIVAGVVAQMVDADPSLTPAEIKDILQASARPLPGYGKDIQGAGAVDPHRALDLVLQRAARGSPRQLSMEDLLPRPPA